MRLTKAARLTMFLGLVTSLVLIHRFVPAAIVAGIFTGALVGVWWKSTALAYQVVKVVDALANHLHLVRYDPPRRQETKKTSPRGWKGLFKKWPLLF
jgi:hypothetical protein